MKPLLKSELRSWTEGPIVETLRHVLEKELDEIFEHRANHFLINDPVATHTERARCLGVELILRDMIDILSFDTESDVWQKYFLDNDVILVEEEAIEQK